jgi:hypothetical protein
MQPFDFDRLEFAGSPPFKIEPNVPYKFNFHYVNGGAETATNMKLLAKIDEGKADNKRVEVQLAHKFERDWVLGVIQSPVALVPDYPTFGTTERTFNAEEVKEMNNAGTIYYLLRFEYSDDTGRWRTDACGSFQRSSPTQIDTNIFHPCSVFQRFRYPAR